MLKEEAVASLDDIHAEERLNYIGRPVVVVERKMKVLHNKEIPLVKVQ